MDAKTPETIQCQGCHGIQILAKRNKGDLIPVTYTNRSQAQKKAAQLGDKWTVYQFGRPFLVGLKAEASSPEAIATDYTLRARSARKAGAVCEIDTTMETVFIRDTTGEEMFRQGQSAQDLIDAANETIRSADMEGLVSLEDYLLTTCA